MKTRILKWLLFILGAVVLLNSCNSQKPTEILWDVWGVPHIYGKNNQELFYSYGWAQMHSHADAILRSYGEARGKAAEYWGRSNLRTDKLVHLLGIPTRSKEWFEAQSPEYKLYIQAFTKGMNDFAKAHADDISADIKMVLPVSEFDIMAHLQYIWHLIFLGGQSFYTADQWNRAGSNAWAIGPSRSASGNALLLSNPHLSWGGYLMWYESHLVGPDVNAYGANILGMPFQIMGFNDDLGWANTVNTIDAADLFELTLAEGGYKWDGGVREFEKRSVEIKVKGKDGVIEKEEMEILMSVHGPIISQKEEKAVAVRMAGLDQPHIIEQVWQIKRAKKLEQFEEAISRLQIPMLNFLYADREGHIMYLFSGRTPKRSGGDWLHWSGVVPGDSSTNLWTETHAYDELPKVIDPPSGWLQNTNDPPWYCTFPQQLDPEDFPSYMAPQGMHFRAQRSVRMLMADEEITFDEFLRYKMSTRMELADRILDDLIPAVRKYGEEKMQKAVELLEAWDRKADAKSRGAVLFNAWVREMGRDFFAQPWSSDDPLNTPDGLADPVEAVKALERAMQKVEKAYGTLDIPWGNVFRLKYGDEDLPANGGFGSLGIFSVLSFAPDPDRTFRPRHGEGYIALIEFADPVRAKVLMTYGNSTQPKSSHRGDQLEMFLNREFRTAWRTRKEIEANLERRETFDSFRIR